MRQSQAKRTSSASMSALASSSSHSRGWYSTAPPCASKAAHTPLLRSCRMRRSNGVTTPCGQSGTHTDALHERTNERTNGRTNERQAGGQAGWLEHQRSCSEGDSMGSGTAGTPMEYHAARAMLVSARLPQRDRIEQHNGIGRALGRRSLWQSSTTHTPVSAPQPCTSTVSATTGCD